MLLFSSACYKSVLLKYYFSIISDCMVRIQSLYQLTTYKRDVYSHLFPIRRWYCENVFCAQFYQLHFLSSLFASVTMFKFSEHSLIQHFLLTAVCICFILTWLKYITYFLWVGTRTNLVRIIRNTPKTPTLHSPLLPETRNRLHNASSQLGTEPREIGQI